MYSVQIHNRQEMTMAIGKIGRRKGKLISSKALEDGDLFSVPDDSQLQLFSKRADGTICAYPAWSYLFGKMCIGYGGTLDDLQDIPVRLLAHKADYPQPIKDHEITTTVQPRADGSVCCQNFIYHHAGQHYRISRQQLDELKARMDRNWKESAEPCTCDLTIGQCREYDGRTHKLF